MRNLYQVSKNQDPKALVLFALEGTVFKNTCWFLLGTTKNADREF